MDKARKFHVAIGSTKQELVKLYAKEIARVEELERALCFIVREELGGMEYEDDTECIEYFITLSNK